MPKTKDLRRMAKCQLEEGNMAFQSGDGVVVSFTADLTAPGGFSPADLRMEVRYEVEAIVDCRGEGDSKEYEVRWAKWPTSTWEPAVNLIGATAALKAFESTRKGKKRKKGQ
uniref:Chromo domain-containing protein n=1 Tax=Haptolina ericina TaxID=156174 RepID=A0A7S3AQ48_9EUKA